MKKNGKGKVLFTALLLASGMTMTSFAGQWSFDGPENWKWHYQNDDGSYTTNNWQEIDGKWYHFDANGYLDIGWQKISDGTGYKQYLFDSSGAMVTDREWEGGYLRSDGSLYVDEIDFTEDGTLFYYRFELKEGNGNSTSYGTLEWKKQLLNQLRSQLNSSGLGTTNMDYQLPANWSEECPDPLMGSAIDWACFDSLGYDAHYSWSYKVDENSVMHLQVTRTE